MESTVTIKSNSNTKWNLPGLVWNGSPDTEKSKQNKGTSQLLFIVYETERNGINSDIKKQQKYKMKQHTKEPEWVFESRKCESSI